MLAYYLRKHVTLIVNFVDQVTWTLLLSPLKLPYFRASVFQQLKWSPGSFWRAVVEQLKYRSIITSHHRVTIMESEGDGSESELATADGGF